MKAIAANKLSPTHIMSGKLLAICHCQDLRTQLKKPGFFTKILRYDPQIISKTRFLGLPA